MQHHWFRHLSVVAFALVMAACSSSGKKDQHPEPLPGSEQPGVTAPAQSDSEIGRSVDASGNPINPQTGVALTRVFYFDYDKAVAAAGIAGDSRTARRVPAQQSRSAA